MQETQTTCLYVNMSNTSYAQSYFIHFNQLTLIGFQFRQGRQSYDAENFSFHSEIAQ